MIKELNKKILYTSVNKKMCLMIFVVKSQSKRRGRCKATSLLINFINFYLLPPPMHTPTLIPI